MLATLGVGQTPRRGQATREGCHTRGGAGISAGTASCMHGESRQLSPTRHSRECAAHQRESRRPRSPCCWIPAQRYRLAGMTRVRFCACATRHSTRHPGSRDPGSRLSGICRTLALASDPGSPRSRRRRQRSAGMTGAGGHPRHSRERAARQRESRCARRPCWWIPALRSACFMRASGATRE